MQVIQHRILPLPFIAKEDFFTFNIKSTANNSCFIWKVWVNLNLESVCFEVPVTFLTGVMQVIILEDEYRSIYLGANKCIRLFCYSMFCTCSTQLLASFCHLMLGSVSTLILRSWVSLWSPYEYLNRIF